MAVLPEDRASVHDWTKRTSDPLNPGMRDAIVEYLHDIRRPLPSNNYDEYLVAEIAGKSVIDIGVCEHTSERMGSAAWKHSLIREHAREVVGVDIIEDLVEDLQKRGMDVVVCDATSDTYLGRTFDVIHAGDVIEHVDNPVAFLRFCKRHLAPGGKVIVRTPNLYCFNYVYLQGKFGTDKSNLEHLFALSPVHALELGRRSGLRLTGNVTLYPGGFTLTGLKRAFNYLRMGAFRRALAEFWCKPEQITTVFVFEFTSPETS